MDENSVVGTAEPTREVGLAPMIAGVGSPAWGGRVVALRRHYAVGALSVTVGRVTEEGAVDDAMTFDVHPGTDVAIDDIVEVRFVKRSTLGSGALLDAITDAMSKPLGES